MTSPQPPADSTPPEQKQSMLNASTTQTIEMLAPQKKKETKFFLIRRRPFRRIDREWERPEDQAVYNGLLMQDGFLTPELIGGSMSPSLEADIRELDQHLLPHFWRMDQLAKYYQNIYYQYQWLFILSAFLTTVLAATNVYLHTQGSPRLEIGLGSIVWTEVLGLFTAAVSGVAAAVAFLDAAQTPQKQWYKARAQAEGLRSLYFLFIARQRPFNIASERDRVQVMREKVLSVLRSSGGAQSSRSTVRRSTTQTMTRSDDAPSKPTTENESDKSGQSS